MRKNSFKPLIRILAVLFFILFIAMHYAIAGEQGVFQRFTAKSTDDFYNSPIIGNGQIITTIGPTGYHNGTCHDEEKVNRTIFWAGRRLKNARNANVRIPRIPPEELIGPTRPLIRYGRLDRTIIIDGEKSSDDSWEQTLDCDNGQVISTVFHKNMREQTTSLVCLAENVIVFHTELKNTGKRSQKIQFTVDYQFGDSEGYRTPDTKLHIRKPHPKDLPFGNVEGIRTLATDVENRSSHVRESLVVYYDVNDHLGEVHIGRYPLGKIQQTEAGGLFIHEMELNPGESTDLWFWIMLSDRYTFTYFPDYDRVKYLLNRHGLSWKNYWEKSQVEFGNPELEAIRMSCLYDIRCNASPWYIPPGYLSTTWEGRAFHDEFYPFMALLSGNHADIAERTPNNRLRTLPYAIQRGRGRGAYYAWESTEDGEDSAPYGHWTDERFIAGIFSEEAWSYYLHTRDIKDLARFYPVIRECTKWLIYDVLRRDENGHLETRLIADMNETIFPVKNSLFLLCAIIKSLENAVRAAEILNVDEDERLRWSAYSKELHQMLPHNEYGYRYLSDKKVSFGTSNLAMVFPFPFDIHGKISMQTGDNVYKAVRSGDLQLNWIWSIGRLATAMFYQGRANEGYEVLKRAPASVGSFLAPNEQFRKDKGPYLAWYTVGAGAFAHAVHAMFVQVVDENDPVIFPAIPDEMKNARFDRLLASFNVSVAGELADSKVVSLNLRSERPITWRFRLPLSFASTARFIPGVTISEPDERNLVTVNCNLKKGDTELIRKR